MAARPAAAGQAGQEAAAPAARCRCRGRSGRSGRAGPAAPGRSARRGPAAATAGRGPGRATAGTGPGSARGPAPATRGRRPATAGWSCRRRARRPPPAGRPRAGAQHRRVRGDVALGRFEPHHGGDDNGPAENRDKGREVLCCRDGARWPWSRWRSRWPGPWPAAGRSRPWSTPRPQPVPTVTTAATATTRPGPTAAARHPAHPDRHRQGAADHRADRPGGQAADLPRPDHPAACRLAGRGRRRPCRGE